ncbi:guanine nucleotide-binding protein subunit alpha [Rhodotorula toruloides]
MGCGASTPVDPEAQARSAAIEKTLAQDREKMRREIKLLFLGAGESGKSTIMKQFQLAYGRPFTREERDEYRDVIFDNAVRSMQVVIDAFDLLSIEVPESLNEHIELLMSIGDNPELSTDTGELKSDVGNAIATVWAFEGAQEAVEMSHEFQRAYFENIARLVQQGDVPSDLDILRSRVKTTGITEIKLDIHGTIYRMMDVGGQRSERKKWINCFQDVQVLLFVLAISEYNQMLYEDETVSRISEATTLWQSIANSKWFALCSIILFLNKIDIYRQKLELYKLSDYIPEYTGPNTYEATTRFLAHRFSELYTNPTRPLIMHLTCATDASQIRTVFAAVQEQILANNLLASGRM